MSKKVKSIFKIVLLVMMIIAFGYTLFIQNQIVGLEREQQVLFEELGDFRNTDVNKIRLLQFDTGDPYRFKWRFVLPKNRDFRGDVSSEGTGATNYFDANNGQEQASHSIAVFLELDGEIPAIHLTGALTTKCVFPKGDKLAGFLRKHWNELQIDTAGSKQMLELASDKTVEVFALRIPPTLIEKIKQELPGQIFDRVNSGPLFSYRITPR